MVGSEGVELSTRCVETSANDSSKVQDDVELVSVGARVWCCT